MDKKELTLDVRTVEHLTKLAATKVTKKIVAAIARTGKKNLDDAIVAARKSRHLDDKFLADLDNSFIKATYEKHMHGAQHRPRFKNKAGKTPSRRLSINVDVPKKNFFGRAMDKIFGRSIDYSGRGLKSRIGTSGTKKTKIQVGLASGTDVHRQNLSRAAKSQKETVERGLANMQGAPGGFKKLPGTKPGKSRSIFRKDIDTKVKVMAGMGLAGVGAFALGRNSNSDNYSNPYSYKYASAETPVNERVKHKITPQAINELVDEWMHRTPPPGVQKETMAYSITKSAEAKNASATLPNQYAKTQQVNKVLASVVRDLKIHSLSKKVDKLAKK